MAKFDAYNILTAISHNNPFDTHYFMTPAQALNPWRVKQAVSLVFLLMLVPMTGYMTNTDNSPVLGEASLNFNSASSWDSMEQPWGQYSRVPTHNGTMPIHSPSGGPGSGSVANLTSFGIIDSPTVNWVATDDIDGSDTYGSIIGDFSASIVSTPAAVERCGEGELFAVIITSDGGGSKLSIVSGDEAKIAWEVDLGQTQTIRSTPMLTDINADDKPEIILVYDTDSSLEIEVWSPELSCSESGWVKSGHENEKMWSMSDTDYSIGIDSPHFPTTQSNHKSVTQPMLADLDLDGDAELVLAIVDKDSENPTVAALTLTTSTPNDFDWEVVLDRGTHPSDPSWGMLDDDSTAIVLTTIDSNSGNMWIWRIDGSSGSLDWERVSVSGTDSDSDAPRLRLPGPVVVQLDNDAAPEMILTIPTDANGRSPGNGARFVAMEMTSTDEIFEFRTPNGYSDSQPLPIDTDEDGIHDRLCWVTWYSESSVSFNRKGMAGCHDISADPPIKEWSKDMQRGSGNDNDEIAVSPPIWMDINGDSYAELIVPFGKRLWAFDGEDGTSSEVSDGWSSPLGMPNRVWSAPAVADMDDDGTLDILIGDTLISQNVADFAPLSDNRGISFNPSQPDPGNTVTVTGQFSNVGTLSNEDDLDVVITQNGNEIARQRFTDVEPVAPSGNGGPYTFSVDIVAELGIHSFELILDINGNLTEAREDNNHALVELVVVEPYAAQIDIPNQIPRINPGTTETITVSMLATGSRTESWTLSWDDSNLPNDWSIVADSNQNLNPTLIPGIAQQFVFIASIPGSALGDDNSFVALTLTLDSNTEIEFNSILPIEVLRTRGLSIVGPSGLDSTEGYGRPGDIATAWMMVENLGNAYETTTSIDWTAPSWGGTPTLHDNSGTEVFSLNLAPGEVVELLVNLNTPINVQLGSVTATTMTMCIGSGQETLCEDLFVNLTAASVTVESIHQRTLPNQTLEWSVEGLIPSDGVMSWNIGSANMIHSNWVWTVSGDLSFDGSNIGASGNPDEPFSGNIYLQLPVNAIPQRHYFTTNSQSDDYHGLYFTLHVLQVYRSSATIVQPVPNNLGEPVSMFVEITNQVLLRLENPGNGQDDFLLSTEVIAGPEMTSPPVVTVVEYNPQRTLGPLASTIATVDITLSEDTPAQEPFMLRFKWQSLEGENVESIVDLLIEAEPDHSWDLDFAGGLNYNILPSETLNLNFTVKNTGNALDNILIKPDFELNYFENDVSIWSSLNKSYDDIAVNQTVSMDLSVIAPSNTWSGTTATLRLDLYSDDLYVSNVSLTLNVIQISGWRLNLSDTNLIIAPGGQNLTLNVEHLGNLARQPWYSKAGEGWNITVPQNGNTVQPYDDTTVTIFVTPPSNSVAGEVGVLRLRVSDGDGSGQTIQEVPVRVGSSPSIDLYSKGDWLVNNSQESMPTTWIENTGNDLAILNLNVIGVPNDWTVNYPETMVVSPGQVIGLPIGLLPSTTWDGSTISIDIAVTHPVLGTQSITMNLKQSDFAFTSSPVISGVVGELATISTTNDEVSVTNDISLSDSTLVVMIPNTKQNITLNSLDGIDEYYIHSAGYTLPEYTASCSFISSSMSELGMMILSDKIGSCSLTAAQDTRFSGSVVVLTNAGENVPLERSQFSIAQDQSSTFDINTSNWKPEAGSLTLTLLVVDSYGREIVVETTEVISRSDGWNIGISEMTAEENIRIALTRTSYQRLVGVTCTIILDSPDNPWTQSIIVDIGGIDYAPTIEIKDPGVFSSNDEIRAEFRCTSPYDIDDNPDDDTAEAFYQPPKSEIIESSQVIFSLFTIVIILGGAYFAGLLTANKPRNTKPAKSNEEPSITETTEQDDKIEDIVEEDIDDFSLEIEQDSNEDIVEIIDLDESESTISQSIDDSSASGRLASLRDEIMTDDKPVDTRPISDRMADFFND
jgi:hypothetical protein